MRLTNIPEPPEHLQSRGRAKWRELCGLKLQMERGLRINDLSLIEFAAISYDKAMEALEQLDEAGLVHLNSESDKLTAHPAAALLSRFHADYVKRLIDLELARIKPPVEQSPAEPEEVPVPELEPRQLMGSLRVVG